MVRFSCVTDRDFTDVDAGVLSERPKLFSMPYTGLGVLLPLILLAGVGGLVGSLALLRRRPMDDVSPTGCAHKESGE